MQETGNTSQNQVDIRPQFVNRICAKTHLVKLVNASTVPITRHHVKQPSAVL